MVCKRCNRARAVCSATWPDDPEATWPDDPDVVQLCGTCQTAYVLSGWLIIWHATN